ncbi:SgcJ/EcaC family oxidoreductase [Pseudomonas petrae]|uniref:SgcJ/EcaC family oxidoreductase n=1 Tax=Pseudomonas petrae TaxID=2912190 RepID=A0ABS9IA77_9PSED|nr:SgcJ/EcaC family oxidoreductase [Pseudomonas petrae]MCF7534831.1 SgcJ/EcaC family oxidoreductase [Pseudomonas petrae]MCF7539445.1 SgcJ/EcaC family oxidoreductase [Pseudomonas petrae]MCF7544141.1 SgcJ/EcaC family oxidoreductase [Pseudomonas petrae]MCF7557332.1 SgcJ/EcaC family oxidoreductase [Pseudomonas petrae]
MLKSFALITLLATSTLASANNAPIQCATLDKQQAAILFERWNNALKTGDSREVAANYTPDAVLLPTLSNQPRTDLAGKLDYFNKFLKNKPVGTVDSSTVITSCNSAIDTGTYTFRFSDTSAVKARYTFTYALVDNQWLITSHHSSAMPE